MFSLVRFELVQQFLSFLTDNSYVQTGLYGFPLCLASKKAHKLIVENNMRITVIEVLSQFGLLLGQLLITGVVGIITYYTLKVAYQDTGAAAPTILTMLVAFAVSGVFTSMFQAIVQTIIQDFVKGEPPAYLECILHYLAVDDMMS